MGGGKIETKEKKERHYLLCKKRRFFMERVAAEDLNDGKERNWVLWSLDCDKADSWLRKHKDSFVEIEAEKFEMILKV